jgi:hypothetical protein
MVDDHLDLLVSQYRRMIAGYVDRRRRTYRLEREVMEMFREFGNVCFAE